MSTSAHKRCLGPLTLIPAALSRVAAVKVDMIKEPLTQGDTGVDEVDFAKITLDDAFKYLNVSGRGQRRVERGYRHQQPEQPHTARSAHLPPPVDDAVFTLWLATACASSFPVVEHTAVHAAMLAVQQARAQQCRSSCSSSTARAQQAS
eukprot:1160708-Pelagomonas_calceolata.AAC.3